MSTAAGFALYVDDKPTQFFDSLNLAKLAADSSIRESKKVRIESFVAPARSEAWYWDADESTWAHRPNAAGEA